MSSDTDGDWTEPPGLGGESRDPDSYWRRRFFILAGGLALVGSATWGLSALVGPPKPIGGRGASHGHAVAAGRAMLPAVAYGAPSGAAALASASPSVIAAPGVSRAARQAGPPAGASSTPPSPASPTTAGSHASAPGSSPRAGKCSPRHIVFSLFTSQQRYSTGQQPKFEVYAVSTAAGPCDLPYGPSVVRVIVTRQGQVLWDSAACRGRAEAKAKAELFEQGVPQLVTLTWSRQASPAGCARSVPVKTTGAFDAVAMADGSSSPVRTFTLAP
jgi:hypothetical protein